MWKEAAAAELGVPSRHSPAGSGTSTRNLIQDKRYLDRHFNPEAWVLVIRLRQSQVYVVQLPSKFTSLSINREDGFPKDNSVWNWTLSIGPMFHLFYIPSISYWLPLGWVFWFLKSDNRYQLWVAKPVELVCQEQIIWKFRKRKMYSIQTAAGGLPISCEAKGSNMAAEKAQKISAGLYMSRNKR
jgi:hypothetical protein